MKTRFTAFIAILFTVFFIADARAQEAPPAPGAGTPTPAQTPAPAASQTPPEARREDVEPKTLAEATALLKSARTDRDKAEKDRDDERAAHDKTKQLLKSTNEIATRTKDELATANTNLATVTRERDDERAAHGKTKELLTLAEGACGVHGVDPKQAIKQERAETPEAQFTQDEWAAKLSGAPNVEERAKVLAAFRKAAAAGQVKRG